MKSVPEINLAVFGFGCVGWPLAVKFGKVREVVGFDVKPIRIEELRTGLDSTLAITTKELEAAACLVFSASPDGLVSCNFFMVSIPTPIEHHKRPDLTSVLRASETVGRVLRHGEVIVYEFIVYLGCTGEGCVTVLEKFSGPGFSRDFICGCDSERINPSDKQNHLTDIVMATAGATSKVADLVDKLYKDVISPGTHKPPSIQVAEAAKVIKNTQRDLNIALLNELAMIFSKMGLDTEAVLLAARSKWNFLPFHPGLVGGHCIGVVPYYLTHKAQSLGHHSEIIIAGRRLRDSMGAYVVAQLVKAMTKRQLKVYGARILVMGLAFDENCPALRNSRVVDIMNELGEYHCKVDVIDSWVYSDEALQEYDISIEQKPVHNAYDALMIAESHQKTLC